MAPISSQPINPFSCMKCGARFPTYRPLIEHSKTHIGEEWEEEDTESEEEEEEVEEEEEEDCGNFSFVCNVCDARFSTYKPLVEHAKQHVKVEKGDTTSQHVVRDKVRPHKEKEENMHRCGECNKSYAHKGHLLRHIKVVHEKENHSAVDFNGSLKRQVDTDVLRAQVKRERREDDTTRVLESAGVAKYPVVQLIRKPVSTGVRNTLKKKQMNNQYSECDRKLKKEVPGLQALKVLHRKSLRSQFLLTPFLVEMWHNKCGKCGVSFQSDALLERHTCVTPKKFAGVLRSHHAEVKTVAKTQASRPSGEPGKRKKCSQCSLRFQFAVDLVDHYARKHKKLENLVCKVCAKDFSDPNLLTEHTRQCFFHRLKWFKCCKCPEQFESVGELGKHHRENHSDTLRFPCVICSRCFASPHGLRNHATAHSDVRLFECKDCNRRYKWERDLQHHMKTVHPPAVEG